MLTMDQIHHIRQLYYTQGLTNLSEISRLTGLNWKTVSKYIDKTDFNVPDPMPEETHSYKKLDPYKALIDSWLEGDKGAPRKQRHTAKKVYRQLQKEAEGFDCSYRLVADYVREKKVQLNLKKKEGFIPLIHQPGEAQADFGAADFYENSTLRSGKYFVLDFPYSNSGYLQLHRGENLECLLESMQAIFEHIGGVPREIWFDNTKTIVTAIAREGNRELTERFTRFQEHYGFEAVFCNPNAGNEKGGVESKTGYLRRTFMVPVPRFISLQEYNRQLLNDCDEDLDRPHYRFPDQMISERFAADTAALLPLPEKPFDTASYMRVRTDNWGKFKLDSGKHIYSASPELAGQDIWVKLTAEYVLVMDEHRKPVVTHDRLYGDDTQESMQWLPYLRCIAQKPRSLRNSGIYSMLPGTVQQYLDNCRNSERGRALKILSELTERTGFDSAVQTVSQAVTYQVTDADSLMNLYRRLYSDVPVLPPLTPQPGVPSLSRIDSGLSDYDLLLERGCGA